MAQDIGGSNLIEGCGQPRPTAPVPGVVVRRTGAHAVVTVTGRVDPEKTAEISWLVRGFIEAGVRELVVDLAGSREGAGLLPELARVRAALAGLGGVLHLSGAALPELLAALVAAPLDEVFLVYDTVRPAPHRDRAPARDRGGSGPTALDPAGSLPLPHL